MNTNTLLLVVILVLLVGGGVWWYSTYGPGAPEPEPALNLELGASGNQ